jgi:2',3'-cyclic-nucleotide 2'-phosphodiesterase (5'-nucleotidase family)
MRIRTVLLALLLLALRASAAPGRPEALIVLAGDQHSAYERTAQVVGLVDRLKAEHPGLPLAVILDGDTQEYGNAIAQRSGGAIDFAMYAALARRAPTIVNLGNHEPEFYDLAETVKRIEATGARVVGNITNRETGRLFTPASLKLALGEGEATVVGVTTDKLATYRVAIRPSLDLANPVVWAKANFPRLLADATLPIVVSHAGIAADREMLPLVPEGTLFTGAHDHQRFVEPFGRTIYFHSGSWNSHLSLAWLDRDEQGRPRWTVEQVAVSPDGPADPELQGIIARVMAENLTDADRIVVGRTAAALPPADAARFVVGALRTAAGVDAAFIGNTTFGAGLPAGGVTRMQFDACVRFDGNIFVTEVDGVRLKELLAAANLTPETPFSLRKGEFNYAAGPDTIDPARTYRIATTDWGARNTARYFGEPALTWKEAPGLMLKPAIQAALAAGR